MTNMGDGFREEGASPFFMTYIYQQQEEGES